MIRTIVGEDRAEVAILLCAGLCGYDEALSRPNRSAATSDERRRDDYVDVGSSASLWMTMFERSDAVRRLLASRISRPTMCLSASTSTLTPSSMSILFAASTSLT